MKRNTIYEGDSLEVLKTFPDGSVDCCICSPPYWSLRSYETAKWTGGDPNCDHVKNPNATKVFGNPEFDKGRPSREQTKTAGYYYKGVCGKCGATCEDKQLGHENTIEEFVNNLCDVFSEVHRVLKKTGGVYVNLGDTYVSSGGSSRHFSYKDPKYPNGRDGSFHEPSAYAQSVPTKSLAMIPFRFAIEMVNRGFILRNTLVWSKSNSMPESCKDRFTNSHEYIFFFTKSQKYYFEQQFEPYKEPLDRWGGNSIVPKSLSTWDEGTGQNAYRERELRPNDYGRNKRSVWSIPTKPFKGAHFATFNQDLIEIPIIASTPEKVCKKCGTIVTKVHKKIGYIDNVEPKVNITSDTPYSVIEREGFVAIRDLPSLKDLKKYLNKWKKISNLTIEEIEKTMDSQAPHHWFSGESYPTKEDWIKLKELLNFDDVYDLRMTTETYKLAEKEQSKYEIIYESCDCNVGFDKGIVLDPFMGSGTTAVTALKLGRDYVGIELSPKYIEMAEKRIEDLKKQKNMDIDACKENNVCLLNCKRKDVYKKHSWFSGWVDGKANDENCKNYITSEPKGSEVILELKDANELF